MSHLPISTRPKRISQPQSSAHRPTLVLATILTVATLTATAQSVELSQFYRSYFEYLGVGFSGPAVPEREPTPAGFPPQVRVVGGGNEPAPVEEIGLPLSSARMLAYYETDNYGGSYIRFVFSGPPREPCGESVLLPKPLYSGTDLALARKFKPGSSSRTCDPAPPPFATSTWTFNDRFTFGTPIRRKTIDGIPYEVSPMVMTRNGVPWMTYYFGYRMGLVAGESNWAEANKNVIPTDYWPWLPTSQGNFELVKLPPPFVEGEVIEYVNNDVFPKSGAGHFFYAASDYERNLLDQAPTWKRTGRGFKSGGYVSVCRFYGSADPGPNSHFFTADETECNALKQVPFLHYEGQTFRTSLPIPATAVVRAQCPTKTVPLYRFYNNPAGKGYDGNHRYVTNLNAGNELIARYGWINEGIVMCVPE